jgi:hypothetical protein
MSEAKHNKKDYKRLPAGLKNAFPKTKTASIAVNTNPHLPKHIKTLIQEDVYQTDDSEEFSIRSRIGSRLRSRQKSFSVASKDSQNSRQSKNSKVKSSGNLILKNLIAIF